MSAHQSEKLPGEESALREARKQARDLRRQIRSRAWTLAQREYARLMMEIEQRIAAGALDPAGIQTWEPNP